MIGRGIYIDTEDKVWLIGFIDPLNQYDYTKKFEYYAKMPQHGTTMSCVPPHIYAPRFKDFMNSILVEDPRRFSKVSSFQTNDRTNLNNDESVMKMTPPNLTQQKRVAGMEKVEN